MQKGTIGVTTDNIFPVIKKFLYSDHEIFLRELVSNAVDATQKLQTLARSGALKEDLGDLTIHVNVDKDKGTLTISDRGIGMTEEEVQKYINQIALSGATDFLDKYKDQAANIIGHFGLGFYSAFMVSKRVELVTCSWKEGAKAVKWSCDGTPAFEITDADKADRGTDVILYIDDDCKEFLEKYRVLELLRKYCHFLPVPIACGKKTEWKDGKEQETVEDNIINDTHPLWTRKPTELKDEDYKKFYRELYPEFDEPLFWIHLNVDYPFKLTGVLYFPKIKNTVELQKNKIQLYCNQVFVTDQVDNIVPEFLTLLHGVIDSPDIPLNVSRSYLQSDANVKKISKYITKKVSDRLESIFKENRKDFEAKWDDLKLFINYGLLSDPDFYEKAKGYVLLKDVDGKYFTYDEYRNLIKDNQTDKDKTLVYLYATDRDEQYTYIHAAQEKGYSVLLMDGQLDPALISMLEQKLEKCRWSRVDGDIAERLIPKEDSKLNTLAKEQSELLASIFSTQMPKVTGGEFHVEAQAQGEKAQPLTITQSEYMRRMKDLSKIQQGMSFYGQMPNMYNVVLNSDHPLIKSILDDGTKATAEALKPIDAELKGLHARQSVLRDQENKKKPEEVTQEEKDELSKCDKDISSEQQKRTDVIAGYAKGNDKVHQLIDLALLQNGLLRGEALVKFIQRSVDLIK
ncbi:MAG: molecular chaperone HtpG [Prevotellaceae bacterium]|nr:molecular chaperone HtpG [Prevotellaceae bacterium]MDY3856166.1 molecular chaperone HtpG [Bacteroidaceae bacterium]